MPSSRLPVVPRTSVAAVALATLVIAGGCAPSDPESEGDLVVIRDVVVRSMAGDAPSPDDPSDVFISNGRIEAIEPAGSRAAPAGARSVDGAGQYLIPGLVDMHVHLGDDRVLVPFLAHGVTTVRNMWGFERDLEARRRIAAGELLGPRIVTAGPLTDGEPPIWAESETATSPEEVRRIMDEQKAAGYDFFKVYERLSPEVFAAALAHGAEIDFPVAGHVPEDADIVAAMEGGMASVEHFRGWAPFIRNEDSPFPEYGDGQDPMEVQRRGAAVALRLARGELRIEDLQSEERRRELAALAARTGTAQVPTLVTNYYLDQPRSVQESVLQREGMRYLDPTFATTWDPSLDFRNDGLTEEERVAYGALMEGRLRSVKALHDAGATVLVGTDTPNPYVMPGYSVHEELALFVEAGLTPREALIAATRAPAEFLGEAAEWGTLEPGKEADAVLLGADPLDDIGATLQINGVLLDGRFLDRAALDAALEETARAWLPPADFFESVPEVAGAVWQSRYRIDFSGQAVGATRTGTMTSGEYSHVSQIAMSESGEVSTFTVRFDVDDAGRPTRVELLGPVGQPGEARRSLELVEGGVRAVLDDGTEELLDGGDAVVAGLSPGMVSVMLPFLRRAEGERLRLGILDMLFGDTEMEQVTVTAPTPETVEVVFDRRAADTPRTWTLTTDDAGLVRMVLRESFYEFTLTRVDPAS